MTPTHPAPLNGAYLLITQQNAATPYHPFMAPHTGTSHQQISLAFPLQPVCRYRMPDPPRQPRKRIQGSPPATIKSPKFPELLVLRLCECHTLCVGLRKLLAMSA